MHVCVCVGFVSLHHVEVKGSSVESVFFHGGLETTLRLARQPLPPGLLTGPSLFVRYRTCLCRMTGSHINILASEQIQALTPAL